MKARPGRTVALAALVATMACALAASAPAAETLTFGASADTTYTQVAQDGDNSVKTTLASCPASCEGNAAGQRDVVLAFAVAGMPADARNVTARLRLHSWEAQPAGTTAHLATGGGGAAARGDWSQRPQLGPALDAGATVAAGINEWDVSPAVAGNGTVTLAVQQQGLQRRVYWPSREHRTAELRPQLVVSYERAPEPPGWRLAWSDEFDGAALDSAKWTARDGWVDYDRACITSRPQNVLVGGGVLTVRARRETYSCGGGGTRAYTTGYLDTRGKASFAYGRFEMRAKSPNGPADSRGLWPAFWMRPDDGGNGEIDVVELPGGSQYYRAATVAIFRDYTPTKNDYRHAFATGYPGDGFHTYATEWEPGVIRWYIDGQEIWRRDALTTPWLVPTFGGDASYSRRFHLRLNFQVGGWLGDPDAATVFPADFQVDWVRVWQR